MFEEIDGDYQVRYLETAKIEYEIWENKDEVLE